MIDFYRCYLLTFNEFFLLLQRKFINIYPMKKIAILLVAYLVCVALHAEERHITFGELPKESKVFILTHFKDSTLNEISLERSASLTLYKVELTCGLKMQFDRTGMCTEVSYKKGEVPDAVVPKKILSIVKANFPKCRIQKFEHNERMYEVDLDNGITLTFNSSFRVVDIDK